jgi:hypothetical protein
VAADAIVSYAALRPTPPQAPTASLPAIDPADLTEVT